MNPTRLPDEFWRDDNIFEDEYDSESGETAKHIYSVSQLNRDIRLILEDNFTPVWVEGEVSGLRVPASGHCYFILKDEQSQLKAVVFRREFRALRHPLREGDRIICSGRISLYEPRGEYQLIVSYLEPQGVGALWRAFNELKAKLEKEGLFAPGRKQKIPLLPRRIGIVTSPTGAAIRDLLQVIGRRLAAVEIVIFPVSVQGDRAAGEMVMAFERISSGWVGRLDTVILARGGGSYEDLAAFNDEALARAIAACPLPVISAVGHEIDFTIADFVADLRAPTPSAAAELAVPERRELEERLRQLQRRLLQNGRLRIIQARRRLQLPALALERVGERVVRLRQRLEEIGRFLPLRLAGRLRLAAGRLEYLDQRLRRLSPQSGVNRQREILEQLDQRLARALQGRLQGHRERCLGLEARLEAGSPLAILKRGYAVVEKENIPGVVSDSRKLQIGERLRLRFATGRALCRVEAIEPGAGERE
jgi:exodeoxyribonuclease VII large subunit